MNSSNHSDRDFFEFEKDPLETPRIKGIVLHDILSEIRTIEDLQAAVERDVIQGDLKNQNPWMQKDFLYRRLQSVAEKHWFDGTYYTLNEQEILVKNGDTLRPDRILTGDGRTLVIDYKFGERDKKYLKQVRGYMEKLTQMGLTEVSGYIWYLKENEVEQVLL